MAFLKNKNNDNDKNSKSALKKGPRRASDIYESTQRRVHVNKYKQKHLEETEARKKFVRKTTPGATPELQYIVNHIYSLDEIKNFDMLENIDASALAQKGGHVRSKLAYKFIMQMKNITAKYLLPGQICLFSYNDPKTKNQLEYWDKNPLTLFFGTFRTQNGDIREIGLNLHYYPPYARKQILVKVYETFKSYFEKCFNSPTHKPNALMDYRTLKHIISSDAKIAFGVKEYVPSLRGITYVMPTKLLPIAFYTEGRFSRATIRQVQQFWRGF